MRFDNIPFADVIDFLRDITGANIFVNWRALEAAGIDRKAPLSSRLNNATFMQVLSQITRDGSLTLPAIWIEPSKPALAGSMSSRAA